MLALTNSGKVQGFEKDGVLQFRGIPFGRAERFRAPLAAEPWDGVRDATIFGAIAPQNPSPLESMLGAQNVPSSEDCLFLNVFTPAIDDARRPVMFWIHGGAFTAGAGSVPWYSGVNLARRDTVVVTINYRLGAFGFLHLEPLLGPEFAGAGNGGIRDQVLALEWTRDNIAAFGGDPGNITIFGESAGGMSVATLLGTPGVPDMIRNAIPQSGAAHAVATADGASRATALVLDELGLSERTADGLLEVDVAAMLAAQQAATVAVQREGGLFLPFAPVADGAVLPRHPLDAIRDGAAAAVRVVTGTTSEEWNLFHLMERANGGITEERLHRRIARVTGEQDAAGIVDVYRSSRPGASIDDVWCAIATDYVFRIPAVRLCEAQSVHQPDTYLYEFAYRSSAFEGGLGACHAIDVPFVFDNLDRKGVDFFLGGIDEGARTTAAATSTAWRAFAGTGSPQHDGIPEWPRYNVDDRAGLRLGPEPAVVRDPGAAEREAWASIRS